MDIADDIDIHFNRTGASGGTLAVVAIGTDVYGAADLEPLAALCAAARKAVEDFALRGRALCIEEIIERGLRRVGAKGVE
jgi:hypothetical protein